MAVCCVKSCKNNQLVTQTPEKKHFFRFPVNEARKRRWMEILRVENAGPNSRICMLHFRDDEIDYTSPFRALLSKMAVPSLEPLPRLRRSMPQPIMPQPIISKNHPANYKIDNSQLLQILQSPNMQLEQNGQPLQIKLVPQTGGAAAAPPAQPNNFGMHFMANSQSNVQQPLQIKFVPQTSSPNGPMAVKLVPQQNTQQPPLVQFLPQQQNQNQMAIKFVPQMQHQQSSNQQPLAVKFVPQQNGPQGQQMQIKFVPQQNGQIRPMGVIMPPGAKQNGDMSFKFLPQSNGQFGGNKNNASKQKNKILEEYQHVLEQNGVTVSSNLQSKEENLPQLTPFSRQGGGGQRSENNFPQIQTVHSLADDDENDRRQRKILSGDAREMVWNVYKYFKMNGNPKAIQATSEACCVPIRTLNRILQVARSAHLNMQAFQRHQQPPPAPPLIQNRPQPPAFVQNSRDAPFKLGSAALNRIRQVITNYKCPDVGYPTIFDLFDEVQKFMYFPGEIKTFRNVLRAMGYRWKKRGEHIVLYEQIGEKHWRNVFGFQRRNRMQRKPQPEPEERNTSTPIIPEPTVIIKEEPSETIEPTDHEMEPIDTKAQEEAEDSFDSEYEYQESDKYRGERANRFKQEPSDSAGEGPDDSYKGDLSEFYTVEHGEYEGPEHEQEEGEGDYGDSQDQGEYDQENSRYYGDEQNEGGEDGWRDEGEVSEFMEDQSYY